MTKNRDVIPSRAEPLSRNPWISRLDGASILLAFGAAVFWFLSAFGRVPPMVPYYDGAPTSDPFYAMAVRSAFLNTIAAIMTGASVGMEAVARLMRRRGKSQVF